MSGHGSLRHYIKAEKVERLRIDRAVDGRSDIVLQFLRRTGISEGWMGR
jgi:hypothetical protein